MKELQKIAVAITGASGVHLGLRLIESLPDSMEVFVVVSEGAKEVARCEMQSDLLGEMHQLREKKKLFMCDEHVLSSPIASGSFGIQAMAIVPTSMNVLAKIACGFCDDLISRCASVMIKENRKLLLAPREMPFSPIALKQMSELSALGVLIAPPVAGYYAKIKDLETLERFFVGKWLDGLGIKNSIYERWGM